MKLVALALSSAVCATALISVQALAQEQQKIGPPPQERPGPTTSLDVVEQPVIAAPENGNIILKFRSPSPTQVYFKRPIKAVHIDDNMLVTAIPKSDHIIAFTGLSPGRSNVTIESTDGTRDTYATVTIVREPHDVKIYQSSQINRVTGERRSDSSSAIGGYVVLSCNEIGCTEREPELQPKLPR
ncbi:hypothetical protein [Bradyrhizobium sp. CB1015]|uniref:hypothetical protein n=1 Tax=Bradyrhizobium sp. CB1015 TaxID=2976822 RepID=UPI0021AA2E7C|nr:hypothetical protein [Bradyrhizobium sp. CB1015]UWU89768.1 hypothetical protein N2604_25135 [Bradyrhizobium sp. CB1015]